jgi:hypothetical protein
MRPTVPAASVAGTVQDRPGAGNRIHAARGGRYSRTRIARRAPMSRLARSLALVALLGCCTERAKADTLVLADGRTLDAKVLKDDGTTVIVKTLAKVEKLPAADVKSRTPGESAVEIYDRLLTASAAEPVTAKALWELYAFQAAHLAELPPEVAKTNPKLLPRILKKEPEHAEAHDAAGDAQWDGKWVKKSDLPRLQAEKAKEQLRVDWQNRLKIPVQIAEADHFLLVDNTGDKDLVGRGKILDKAYDALTQAFGVEELWKERSVVVTIKDYDAFCVGLDTFVGECAIPPAIVTAAKDRNTGGVWRHRPYAVQVRWPSTGVEGMWSAILHNCSHVATWTLWGKNAPPPAWIEEGMGAWVEIQVLGQQVASCLGESKKLPEQKGGTTDKKTKKKDPKKNPGDLREAASEYKERCKQAIEADEFPKLRQFLKYGVGDLGPPEEGGTLGLCTWLMLQDPEKFKVLIKMLRLQNKRTDDEYWREAYGFELIDDMDAKWRGWVVGEW